MADYLNLPKTRKVNVNARLHKRFFSFFIDYLIVDILIISVFTSSLGNLLPSNSIQENISFMSSSPLLMAKVMITLGMIGIFVVSYFVYSQKVFGQTVGMKLMNIRLKNSIKGKEIAFWQVLVRNLYLIPLFPFVLMWPIDMIYLIIYNRRLSDVLAKLDLVEESII